MMSKSEDDTPHTPEQTGDALAALDRTQYRRWKDATGAKGYVCGDVPIALLVEIVEAYRHLAASGVPDKREIFYRLANYESDEPYEGGEDQPQFSLSRYVLDQWLAQDHRGDCTNEPFTCSRCFAERCWHKAGWIAAAPSQHEQGE